MQLQHKQRPSSDVYHVYMIFDVTKSTDRKFHLVTKFVRITTKFTEPVK